MPQILKDGSAEDKSICSRGSESMSQVEYGVANWRISPSYRQWRHGLFVYSICLAPNDASQNASLATEAL